MDNWMQNEIRPIDANKLVKSLKGRRLHILLENENDGAGVFDDIIDWIKYTPDIHTAPPGKPLTLEQLRQMDGQPVRVHNLISTKKKFEWQIALVCKFRETAEHSFFTYRFYDYGKTWIAYAYSTAHIDREAWEGCQLCHKSNYIAGKATATTEFLGGEFVSSSDGEFTFCPCCGKPLNNKAWAMLEKRLRG